MCLTCFPGTCLFSMYVPFTSRLSLKWESISRDYLKGIAGNNEISDQPSNTSVLLELKRSICAYRMEHTCTIAHIKKLRT